jgi:hypothetical protein
LFYLAENYERLLEGRIIAVNLAKKWITNFYDAGKPNAAGEELNESNLTGEFERVSLQYCPVVDTKPGDMLLKNVSEFYQRIAQDIEV